jgi:hypothetical protein
MKVVCYRVKSEPLVLTWRRYMTLVAQLVVSVTFGSVVPLLHKLVPRLV